MDIMRSLLLFLSLFAVSSVYAKDCEEWKFGFGDFMASSGTAVGQTARIRCYHGYTLVGDSEVECQSNGVWNKPRPRCMKECGQPEIPNANTPTDVNGNALKKTYLWSKAKVSCKTGYKLEGNAIIECTKSRQWKVLPSCSLLDCGVPKIANDTEPESENGGRLTKTTYGEKAVLRCGRGFQLKGSPLVTCQVDGTWGKLPTCEKDCGKPMVDNAKNPTDRNGDALRKTYVGERAWIRCTQGYQLIGNSVVTCLGNGEWTQLPKCDRDCGNPVVNNSMATAVDGNPLIETTLGKIARMRCNPGYNLKGNEDVTCGADGTWINLPVCIIKDCQRPVIEHGAEATAVNGDSLTITTYGEKARLSCQTGYILNDNTKKIVTCQANGKWGIMPRCEIVVCGNPKPDNGYVIVNVFTYNTTVEIGCNEHHVLEGSNTTTCLHNGRWNNYPKCERPARWLEWKPVSACNGRPCGCEANKNDTCKFGSQLQVRVCLHGSKGDICPMQNGIGSIREYNKCVNRNCPGWSNWTYGECDCTKQTGRVRYCNNPAPTHDVHCLTETLRDNEQRMIEEDEYYEQNCSCYAPEKEEEMTTESPTEAPVTEAMELPCCLDEPDNFNAYGGDNSTDSGGADFPDYPQADFANGPWEYELYDGQKVCQYGGRCPEKAPATPSGDGNSVFGLK